MQREVQSTEVKRLVIFTEFLLCGPQSKSCEKWLFSKNTTFQIVQILESEGLLKFQMDNLVF